MSSRNPPLCTGEVGRSDFLRLDWFWLQSVALEADNVCSRCKKRYQMHCDTRRQTSGTQNNLETCAPRCYQKPTEHRLMSMFHWAAEIICSSAGNRLCLLLVKCEFKHIIHWKRIQASKLNASSVHHNPEDAQLADTTKKRKCILQKKVTNLCKQSNISEMTGFEERLQLAWTKSWSYLPNQRVTNPNAASQPHRQPSVALLRSDSPHLALASTAGHFSFGWFVLTRIRLICSQWSSYLRKRCSLKTEILSIHLVTN